MKQNDIEKVIELRKFIIECHNELDGASNPATAVVKQVTIAHRYSHMIKKLDSILKDYVTMK